MKIGRNIKPTLFEEEKFYKTIYGEMVSHSNVAQFAVDDKVEHKVYGIGEIIEASPERDSYKVLFEKGKRNLVSRVLKHI